MTEKISLKKYLIKTKKPSQISKLTVFLLCMVMILTSLSQLADAARIKDIAGIKGVRDNQLIGYGLVVGLNGTGDDTKVLPTLQSIASMLTRMGVKTIADLQKLRVDNVAAVLVTANLPPFTKTGTKLDVTVSSFGNSESLQGGQLITTPLKGVDGKIYAIAQGPVSIGGFSAGSGGSGTQKNHPTVGHVPSGALVEREIVLDFNNKKQIEIILNKPDFTTASRVAIAVNDTLKEDIAASMDASTITVEIPEDFIARVVPFMAMIEAINVKPDTVAKIVLNERTGTVIMGSNVRISTIAVSHGNLTIHIKTRSSVSQPQPFSEGETIVTEESDVYVQEEERKLMVVKEGVSIGEVVNALNAIGVTPRDLIVILQTIKAAGALNAKLEII